MQLPVSKDEDGLCRGRYHETGMVIGKAGRSLIAGLKHVLTSATLQVSASLGRPFNHPRTTETTLQPPVRIAFW